MERILEQIVEHIEMLPHKRVKQHTAKQIVLVPVHQIQEQSTVTCLVNSLFPITSVASQMTLNTSSTSTSSSAQPNTSSV